MKQQLIMKLFLLVLGLFCFSQSFAISSPHLKKNKRQSPAFISAAQFTAHTGIQLNLPQRIAFYALQKKMRRQARNKSRDRDPSKTALILGIIGISIVWIPLLTLASIPLAILAISIGSRQKKRDPSDRKARTALVIGIITLGIVFVIAMAAAYLLSNAHY